MITKIIPNFNFIIPSANIIIAAIAKQRHVNRNQSLQAIQTNGTAIALAI
jgi:hypothetical protein